MDLYRIVVTRRGWPVWDGETSVVQYLNQGLVPFSDADTVLAITNETKTFMGKLPTLGRVYSMVPTEKEQADGICLITNYMVRSEWEKDEILTFLNQTQASKFKAINPSIQQSAEAFRI